MPNYKSADSPIDTYYNSNANLTASSFTILRVFFEISNHIYNLSYYKNKLE